MTTSPEPSGLPGPNHRDLYLIIAGIVVGLLLGPGVLGKLAPTAYDRLFVGAAAIEKEQREIEAQLTRQIEGIVAAGASEAAVQEKLKEADRRQAVLRQELENARQQRVGWSAGTVLAILIVMIIETLIDPRNLSLRARLATARYGLIALWLALLLAQPSMGRSLPLLFAGLLAAIALLAALLPLGNSAKA